MSLVLDTEFPIGSWSVGKRTFLPNAWGISKILMREGTKSFLLAADFHGNEM